MKDERCKERVWEGYEEEGGVRRKCYRQMAILMFLTTTLRLYGLTPFVNPLVLLCCTRVRCCCTRVCCVFVHVCIVFLYKFVLFFYVFIVFDTFVLCFCMCLCMFIHCMPQKTQGIKFI